MRAAVADMDELVAFLRAREDEREAAARAADGHDLFDGTGIIVMPNQSVGDRSITLQSHIARFAARHDPAWVLADVDAKRRIIDLHEITVEKVQVAPFDPYTGEPIEPEYEVTCALCGWASDDPTSGCDTLRLLALPHAGHPDHREEWRP